MANLEQDFPMDGDPISSAEPMPQTGGLTRIRPPMLSRTGGPQPTGQTPSSGTGMQRGERGAVVTPVNPKVAGPLAPFDLPEETMHSLSVSLASHLVIQTNAEYGSHGFERTTLGPFQIQPGMPLRDLKQNLYAVEKACQRADARTTAHAVAKLSARTKTRVQGLGEAALMAETMVEDLSQYPADVVEYACDWWCKGGPDNKFFPSWPELREICERKVSGRKRLETALAWHVRHTEEALEKSK